MASLYFGGSFNPIHHAHLICSRAVAESLGCEKVVLIPSSQPPHKANAANMAPPSDRLEMCRLATARDAFFTVDDLELRRTGPSYTLDTAKALTDRGELQVNWLIGADMLLYLPQWHRPLELLERVNFIVMARPGWELDWQTLPEPFRALRKNVVKAPLIDISSTDIRRRVGAGQPIEYLTPRAVCEYIQQTQLYTRGTG